MSQNKQTVSANEQMGCQKKEKPTKEKKVIPKYYAGTDIKKLPKIPKAFMKDLDSIEVLTSDQQEKYLTAVILGIIPDKFGLEVGVDSKLKAIAELQRIQQIKEERANNEIEHEEDYFDKLNQTLQERKLEGIDDESDIE